MSKNIFKKSCIILFHSSRLSKLGQENHIIKGLKDLCLSVKFNTALNATGTGIEWARWIFCEKHARFSAVSLCTLYLWGHMSSFRSQALWQISSCFLFFCCCWFFVFLEWLLFITALTSGVESCVGATSSKTAVNVMTRLVIQLW